MDCMTLDEYVGAVTELMDSGRPLNEIVEAIVPLKRRLLATPGLVPDRFLEGLDQVPYTRNLLHSDPQGRFSVIALAWAPGKQSPIHDHQSWGVVGTYHSEIEVIDYAPPAEDGSLAESGRCMAHEGDVIAILPPRTHNIHRMSNAAGTAPTYTIHTYGDPATLCRVYDPKDGRSCDRPLRFHHAL
ncbi:MAG: cysteine dioxygenase family protein [Planctomycetota bacterium]